MDQGFNSSFMNGFSQSGQTKAERYVNPFYGIPLQYLPLSIDAMLWWAEHLLFRNGFYAAALKRISNYFITSLLIECDDETAKEQYEEIFEELDWREFLAVGGLNLLSTGNACISINQGFNRFLVCPKCHKATQIDKINDYQFHKGKYTYKCKSCSYNGEHECNDKPSKDVDRIHVVNWPIREIVVRWEETTGEYEYYWDIPQAYIKKVTTKNNKFYSKKTPKVIYDCIFDKRMLAFNNKNFIHLKMASPSSLRTDGKAIPPCIFMFDDFFMLQVLKRYNEVICMEDIAPFRVISMTTENNAMANPIFHQNGGQWLAAVQNMISEHRLDPGSYHMFPFPLQYQQLGAEGKQLAPVEFLDKSKADLLTAFNIPVELFQMNLQAQAVGPSLRLFENSWSVVPDAYNKLLNAFGEVIAKIRGLPKAKIGLIPVTFADDMERKSIVGQLVAANAISRSELLETYGISYEEQLRKKKKEEKIQKDIDKEEQEKEMLEEQTNASIFNMGQPGQQGGGGGQPQQMSPTDVMAQAQPIAEELFPMGPSERRSRLQQIKAQDSTLYSAVKVQLEDMTRQAKSQGLQGAQQQAQQNPQQ